MPDRNCPTHSDWLKRAAQHDRNTSHGVIGRRQDGDRSFSPVATTSIHGLTRHGLHSSDDQVAAFAVLRGNPCGRNGLSIGLQSDDPADLIWRSGAGILAPHQRRGTMGRRSRTPGPARRPGCRTPGANAHLPRPFQLPGGTRQVCAAVRSQRHSHQRSHRIEAVGRSVLVFDRRFRHLGLGKRNRRGTQARR